MYLKLSSNYWLHRLQFFPPSLFSSPPTPAAGYRTPPGPNTGVRCCGRVTITFRKYKCDLSAQQALRLDAHAQGVLRPADSLACAVPGGTQSIKGKSRCRERSAGGKVPRTIPDNPSPRQSIVFNDAAASQLSAGRAPGRRHRHRSRHTPADCPPPADRPYRAREYLPDARMSRCRHADAAPDQG